jgi:arabinofuranosyltransferase
MSLLDNDKIENYTKTNSAGSLVQPTDNQIVASGGGNFLVANKIRTACVLFFSLVVILLSWQCDDAYHSHKMSLNFANGDGLVYNVGERVNASTCPLHTIIIGCFYKVFGNMYLTSLLLCVAYSIAAFVLLLKSSCRNNYQAVLATMALVFSTSFVSFTTSGLEKPLLFLLFAILLHIFWGKENFSLRELALSSFIGGLILMTRMDNGLFLFPLLLFMLAKRKKVSLPKAMTFMALGLVPFFLWELFSLFYYGFPFPNTAYAKLATGIPRSEYWVRGAIYFLDAFLYDPLVLLFPILFIVSSLCVKNLKSKIVAVGIILYFAYILHIGGDFMRGRHFTVLFFISLFSLFRLVRFSDGEDDEKNTLVEKRGILSCRHAFAFGFSLICAAGIWFPKEMEVIDMQGRVRRNVGVHVFSVADERYHYFAQTALFYNRERLFESDIENGFLTGIVERHPYWGDWGVGGDNLFVFKFLRARKALRYKGDVLEAKWVAAGIIMFHLADGFYLGDTIGLGDPLLSRLPARWEKNWRIGHLYRDIPEGYQESIRAGENKIKDPALAKYLGLLWDITRSEKLFTWDRLQKIINFNLGRYEHLKNEYVRRQKSIRNGR